MSLWHAPGRVDGCDYVALELVEGQALVTVRERKRTGTSVASCPLTSEQLRELMVQAAQTLCSM